jgi:3-hydroxyacyl-CoA dehydrogenase
MNIGIVGSGSIGVAFAIVFARAGNRVGCWDVASSSRDRAEHELAKKLSLLHHHGLLDDDPLAVQSRVTFHDHLEDAVDSAGLVQECAPEDLGLKRGLFGQLSELTRPESVLASSSSAVVPSALADGLPCADRILVGHPGNPPYLVPVIEVVPSPATSSSTIERALNLYSAAGLRPVLVKKEVEGFIFNRLQGALLREAYCLLRDGVSDVEDIDAVVRLGLGRRWGVVGPFETVDLNTRGGIEAHAAKMGPAYERMGAERGQHDPWTADLVALATAQRRAIVPLDDWDARVAWRDEQLMRIAAAEIGETP